MWDWSKAQCHVRKAQAKLDESDKQVIWFNAGVQILPTFSMYDWCLLVLLHMHYRWLYDTAPY